jgi:hypothetical protein
MCNVGFLSAIVWLFVTLLRLYTIILKLKERKWKTISYALIAIRRYPMIPLSRLQPEKKILAPERSLASVEKG